MRDELLNCEIFDTIQEAKVLIERWRTYYNTIRPHSALEYRPPAPESQITDILTGLVFGGPSNGLDTNLKTGLNNGVKTIC